MKSKEEHFKKDSHFRKAIHAHPNMATGREKGRPIRPEAVLSTERDPVSGFHVIDSGASGMEFKRRKERYKCN